MLTVKFSHNYPKLHNQTSAELLAVYPIRIDKNTPKELLEYDTSYLDEAKGEWAHFPLPTGNYIQLVFRGNLGIPFCTIRKAFPQSKVDYYTSHLRENFAIEIVKL